MRYVWNIKVAVSVQILLGTAAAGALAFMYLSDLNISRNAILSGIAFLSLIMVFKKRIMPDQSISLKKSAFHFI